MKDFEKYLKKNKTHLEPDKINSNLWEKMEGRLSPQKPNVIVQLLRYGAAASILLAAGFFLWSYFHSANDEEHLLRHFNLSDQNLSQQVSMRKEKLAKATIPKSQLEDFQVLLQQLDFLDEQLEDYLAGAEKNGYSEFHGNQILQHYKAKIKLLDKIQQEIEKINYYERKKPSDEEPVEIEL